MRTIVTRSLLKHRLRIPTIAATAPEGAMFVRRTLFLFLLTAVLASSLSVDFAAALDIKPKYSEFGNITGLETGWSDDTMSVRLDAPFVNSATVEFSPVVTQTGGGGVDFKPCSTTNAGYALDPKDPGVKVHEAVLLSAFLARRKVQVLVEGCVFSKPRIIAVGIDAVH
jgi:hypothetical protein